MAARELIGAPVVVRLPKELLARLDIIRETMTRDRNLGSLGPISRSAIVRLAVIRGIEQIEGEFAGAAPAKDQGPKRKR